MRTREANDWFSRSSDSTIASRAWFVAGPTERASNWSWKRAALLQRAESNSAIAPADRRGREEKGSGSARRGAASRCRASFAVAGPRSSGLLNLRVVVYWWRHRWRICRMAAADASWPCTRGYLPPGYSHEATGRTWGREDRTGREGGGRGRLEEGSVWKEERKRGEKERTEEGFGYAHARTNYSLPLRQRSPRPLPP